MQAYTEYLLLMFLHQKVVEQPEKQWNPRFSLGFVISFVLYLPALWVSIAKTPGLCSGTDYNQAKHALTK